MDVGGFDSESCFFFHFFIIDRAFDAAGSLRRFTGIVEGRCCGTVAGTFAFDREGSATARTPRSTVITDPVRSGS